MPLLTHKSNPISCLLQTESRMSDFNYLTNDDKYLLTWPHPPDHVLPCWAMEVDNIINIFRWQEYIESVAVTEYTSNERQYPWLSTQIYMHQGREFIYCNNILAHVNFLEILNGRWSLLFSMHYNPLFFKYLQTFFI